ncbi:Uncharacterised protein [Vibrio cholerae]|nr:Uncharacterised protein [Vibrio cholerae]CSD21237.1 Uncharacterised protein [Vibrio cholerae]
MDTARHQVIHDVVFGRNRVKHLRDFMHFFIFTYGFKPKVGRFLIVCCRVC